MAESERVPISHFGAWPVRRVALLALGWIALGGVAALVCFALAGRGSVPQGGGPHLVVEHVPRWLTVGLVPPALLLVAWRWRRSGRQGAS